MPKKNDENETAFTTLQEVLRRDEERNGIPQKPKPKPQEISYRVEAGRKGGLKGGKVRAEKLSAKKRTEIAKKAAKIRWHQKKE